MCSFVLKLDLVCGRNVAVALVLNGFCIAGFPHRILLVSKGFEISSVEG